MEIRVWLDKSRRQLLAFFSLSVLALNLMSTGVANAADSDLGETREIKFNIAAAADLKAKAVELNSPVAIFEYVRNNYDYSLYHGARGGSINTFLGGSGSDVDLAATLIAMYRSRGIPSRYAVGTIRAPASKVANLLGVKNVDLAYSILRDQGIQGVVLSADKSTIDMEHVWVEALLPYSHYRGAGTPPVNCGTTPAECNWVPLDPSFKHRVIRTSGFDPGISSFDYTAYYNAIKNNDASRRDKNPLEIYEEQILAFAQAFAPGKTLEDIPDVLGVIPEVSGLLPASLPYTVLNTVRRYNSAADHDAMVQSTEPKRWAKTLTAQIRLVVGGVTIVAGGGGPQLLTDLSTQRLTLTTEIVGGIPNVVVRLDGVEIARPLSGNGSIGGYTPQVGDPFTITVSMDGAPAPTSGGTDEIISATYSAIVGGYYLLATGGETSNFSQVHRAAKQLLDANTQYQIVLNTSEPGCQPGGINCTPYVDATGNGYDSGDTRLLDNKPALDALTGGLLYVAGTQYYAKLRDQFARADALNKIKTPISGFLGVVSTTYDVEYIDGTAFSVLPGGLLIDMKGIKLNGVWKIDQPATFSNDHFAFLGHIGSSLEHEIWQELTGYDAISTVRGIQFALANNATLLNPKKNSSTDTVAAIYPDLGFASTAPSPFALTERTIYSTRPATWSHPSTNGTQSFVALKKVLGASDSRVGRLSYSNSLYHGNVGCFFNIANQLQDLFNQGGGGQTLNAGSLCLSSFPAGTTVQQAINLNMSDYASYQSTTPQSYFDFLDENKGFSPAAFAFRASSGLASDAQPTLSIELLRNDIYCQQITSVCTLRDFNQAWVEYLIPSKLSVGPNYRFSVDIRKGYDGASGELGSLSFEIQNQGISAGGGYVSGAQALLPSQAVSGTSLVTPTFNNATFTDKNTIAETNNNVVKTPSTSDPVSTVTGNNFHDETDFSIKGRGINYAFTRTYNSATSSTSLNGTLGFGWTHSYGMRLKSNDYGDCPNCAPGTGAGLRPENGNSKTSSVTYTDERGGEHNYLVNETTFVVTSPQGEFETLTLDTPAAGQHTLTFRNGVKYIFENGTNLKTNPGVTARLKQIADPWGNQLNFGYDGNGRLSTVTDNLGISGRTGLVFTYDTASKLSRIADWTGRQWNYSVNAVGDLVSYTNPLNQQMRYTYAPGTHNLFEVIKPLQRGGQDVKTAFKYYENGRSFNYANTLQNTETLDYDLYRKSTRVTDPRGNVREYQYDESGRLTKMVEPDGAVMLFSNSADGLRFKKSDGLGYVTQYSYRNDKAMTGLSDTGGNVTREQDALNQTVNMTYGIYDQVATMQDKRGTTRTTTFHVGNDSTCKANGKPDAATISVLSGVSNVRLMDYCWFTDGAMKSMKEYITPGSTARYRQRSMSYDAAHLNVLSMSETGTDGTLVTRTFTYDSLGRKTSETLQRRASPTNATLINLTTLFTYDVLDRVIRVEDAIGNRIDSVYDANGQVSQTIGRYKQASGTYINRNISTNAYDAADRRISETDVYGAVTQYRYDPSGNVVASIDPYQHTTRYEYDSMNRRTAIVDANGRRTETTYDLAGRVKTIKNPNGETVVYSYDAVGRLTQLVDPLGFITTMSYDANDNMTCRVDANAQAGLQAKNSDACTESRQYDELNRAVVVRDATNGTTQTAYDLLNNVTSIKDATDKTTIMVYDDLGRLIQSTDPLNKTTLISRDQAGSAYQITNRLNQVTRVTFDNLNRPARYDYLSDGTAETMSYDTFGNRETVSNSIVSYTFSYDDKNRPLSKTDSRSGRKLTFSYDANDNMLSKTDYQGDVTDFQYDSTDRLVAMQNRAYLKAIYQYDDAGRPLTRVLSDGAKSSFTWDGNGRLTNLSMTSANGAILTNLTHTYDRVGNILSTTGMFAPGATDTRNYTYDALYRLMNVTSTSGASESFTYDSVGNRMTHSDGSMHVYEYFSNSNRLKAIHTGTLTGAIEKGFTYDDEGRRIVQTGGTVFASTISWDQKNRAVSMVSTAGTNTFKYDPMNYRIGRAGGSLGARDYYLEGEHLEAEYVSGQLQSKYFRGISTDELVAGFVMSGSTLVPSIYHHDQLTSITATSAHDGATQQGLFYGAFGNLKNLQGSSTNRLRYTGRELDSDTQLYYYRARYYDPSLGRFVSEDPLGFAAGDVNFYAYVGNNPINANDPSGNCPSCIGAGISVLTGGAIRGGIEFLKGGSFGDIASAVFDPKAILVDAALGAVGAGLTNKLSTLSQLSRVNSAAVPGKVLGEIGEGLAGISSRGKSAIPSLSGSAARRFPDQIDDFGNILEIKNVSVIGSRDAAQIYDSVLYAERVTGGTVTVLTRGSATDASAIQGLVDGGLVTLGKIPGINSSGVANISKATSSAIGAGAAAGAASPSAAGGGFLLYPSKPNTNTVQSVYSK